MNTYKKLLIKAVEVIEGLAGQQAMYDDWYEEPLRKIKEEIEKMPDDNQESSNGRTPGFELGNGGSNPSS